MVTRALMLSSIRPTLGDHLGSCELPCFADPVIGFVRLNRDRHALFRRNAPPCEFSRHLPGGAFDELGLCSLCHGVLDASGGAEARRAFPRRSSPSPAAPCGQDSRTGNFLAPISRGKAVARLVPARLGVDREKARAALQRIRERAKQLKSNITLADIKAWRDEGRP